MGSMYKEQKKTNRILSEQTKSNEKIAKANFELQNKQNAELERQNFLLEQEQRNREYQKYLRDFIFEMKKFAEEIGSGKYSEIPAYTAARIVKTRITSEGISSQSFEQIQDKEFYSQAIESLDCDQFIVYGDSEPPTNMMKFSSCDREVIINENLKGERRN